MWGFDMSMNSVVKFDPANAGKIAEQVFISGDLTSLKPEQRAHYYHLICESLGLNPLTKPFEYLQLNGKLVLYALRACTDQLRQLHEVSVTDLSATERDGVYVVKAHVRDSRGRVDVSTGVVTVKGLAGDVLANALMKAETKAKRRATLSICGLGFLDETEIETLPQERTNSVTPTAQELIAPIPLEEEARMAAERGRDTFAAFCRRLKKDEYARMRPYLETLKPLVEKAENDEHGSVTEG